jgi:transcriptional regulator with XRE-family HTH domain
MQMAKRAAKVVSRKVSPSLDDEERVLLRSVARKMAALRNYRNMSQDDVAEAIDISQTSISKFELGRTNPAFTIVVRMARALGAPLDWLFDPALPVLPGRDVDRLNQVIELVERNTYEASYWKLVKIDEKGGTGRSDFIAEDRRPEGTYRRPAPPRPAPAPSPRKAAAGRKRRASGQ